MGRAASGAFPDKARPPRRPAGGIPAVRLGRQIETEKRARCKIAPKKQKHQLGLKKAWLVLLFALKL